MPSDSFLSVLSKQSHAITFAVDDVVPSNRPMWTQPLARSLGHRFQRKILVLPQQDKSVVNVHIDDVLQHDPMRGQTYPNLFNYGSTTHPLIEAVHTAFSQHRPLILSPDCIWLVIAQGFSHHIAESSEVLRDRLVDHSGKRMLTSQVRDLTLGSFRAAISEFSSQIRDASNPVLHETLICNFSTTTPDVRTASEVVLMDSYASYFQFGMRCICGIPKITLTGSLEDWRLIRARIEVFEAYDLEWWVGRLRPLLDELVRTAEGQPSTEFWQAILKPKRAYGETTVTGWIADLFPYLGDAPRRRRNNVFQFEREHWALPIEQGIKTHTMGESGADKGAFGFPSGLSRVPVALTFPNETKTEVDLVAGFLAIEQNPRDLALSPYIGWSVTECAPKKPV